jgi:hypothetical protein
MGNVLGRDVAEQEFTRWADSMGIDIDTGAMAEDERGDFARFRDRIVRAIETGSAVVNDAGELSYTPTRSEGVADLTFYTPRGSAYLASKQTDGIRRLFDAAGDITRQPPAVFSKMHIADVKMVIAVTSLFLAQ